MRRHLGNTKLKQSLFIAAALAVTLAGAAPAYAASDKSQEAAAPEEEKSTEEEQDATSMLKFRYAVQLYGIGEDTLEDGSTGGLTFGPAVGADYTYSTDYGYAQMQTKDGERIYPVDDHRYNGDESRYYLGSTEADDSGIYMLTSSGHDTDADGNITSKDAGFTDAHILAGGMKFSGGNAYRCIHHDDWETIISWNEKDPYVYEKCIENGCVAAVTISPNDGNSVTGAGDKVFHLDEDSEKLVCEGSGVGVLFYELCGTATKDYRSNSYSRYDEEQDAELSKRTWSKLNWKNSNVRAMLNGYGYGGSFAEDYYDSGNSLLSAFPKTLQEHIGARAVKYSKRYGNYGDKAKEGKAGTVYDKLWLFANNEISDDEQISFDYYKYPNEGCQYSKFKDKTIETFDCDNSLQTFCKSMAYSGFYWSWLRSRCGSGSTSASEIGSGGYILGCDADAYSGVAPGFVLARE